MCIGIRFNCFLVIANWKMETNHVAVTRYLLIEGQESGQEFEESVQVKKVWGNKYREDF